MFHTIYICVVMFVLPFVCWLIEKRKNKEASVDILCKWFIFWSVGVRAFTTGAMQFFNSSYTMALLQLGEESKIMIMELGACQLGIGVLGVMSLLKKNYRASAALSYTIFMIGASYIHIVRLEMANIEEILSLLGDIWVIVVTMIYFINQRKVKSGK
ncbi:MAG: hypothetical protein E7231_04970 [Cellulosilyticum sp.]|nr:hypothetical protein [Cellulosilyticum sp.]